MRRMLRCDVWLHPGVLSNTRVSEPTEHLMMNRRAARFLLF